MLRNRKEDSATKLKGVDLISDESDPPIGIFILLQNYVSTEIFSLHKKRGVVTFTSTVIVPVVPGACA